MRITSNISSIMHSVANTFKTCLVITVELKKYTFEKVEVYKVCMSVPSTVSNDGCYGGGGEWRS